jgi:ATP-dependent Lon protease
VMLHARNRRDLEDIPEEARRRVRFVWLERVEDAVHTAIDESIMAERKAPELLPAD